MRARATPRVGPTAGAGLPIRPMGTHRAVGIVETPMHDTRPDFLDLTGDAPTTGDDEPIRRLPGLEDEVERPDHRLQPGRRAYADWTAFEDAFLRQERGRGRPVEEMADALGRSPGSIESRLRRQDADEPRRAGRRQPPR